MPVWLVRTVAERPNVTLESWAVYQVPSLDKPDESERHFVGYAVEDRQGQVSSAVQSFDPITGCGVTRSGRVYHLKGLPGNNSDATYTWARWTSLYGVTEQRDVTDEVVGQISASVAEASK